MLSPPLDVEAPMLRFEGIYRPPQPEAPRFFRHFSLVETAMVDARTFIFC